MFFALCLIASAQTVMLTFTGRNAGNSYVQLNRVVITNLTKGWQETLTWPDTTLVMTATGIGDFAESVAGSLRLSQNNPNPFNGTTSARLHVYEPGEVMIEITDMTGRVVVADNHLSPKPGFHDIRISLSGQGLYFLTARQNGKTASVKMVSNGGGSGNKIEYMGAVDANDYSPRQTKSGTRGNTTNPFTPGDKMEYVGYAMLNGEEVESWHVTQMQETSQTMALVFGGGAVIDEKSCPGTPTVTDHEGNVYATVQIGSQCWMRDNLRTTTSPSTGTYLIPAVGTDHTETGKQAYWYNNDSATYAPQNYGLIYNWNAAVDTFNTAYGETSVNASGNAVNVSFTGNRRGICPAGWHLPSDADWTTLTVYVSRQSEYQCDGNSGFIAKALASITGWITSSSTCGVGNDQSTNNATGFSAVPAGDGVGSSFEVAGEGATFWSSSQSEEASWNAWYRYLGSNHANVYRATYFKSYGFSVRCLRDNNGDTTQTQPTVVVDSKSCAATPTVTDHEGNVYATVQIGTQCWMRDNLRTTHYSDGTSISLGSSPSTTVAYRYCPSSNCSNVSTYGYLYNWKAIMHNSSSSSSNPSGVQGICPVGWHVPSDAEWTQLISHVNIPQYMCTIYSGIAKALASTTGWNTISITCAVGNDQSTNNATGFGVLPAGNYYGSSYNDFGDGAYFWSCSQDESNSSSAWNRSLYYSSADVYRYCSTKENGFSVRCLRD